METAGVSSLESGMENLYFDRKDQYVKDKLINKSETEAIVVKAFVK